MRALDAREDARQLERIENPLVEKVEGEEEGMLGMDEYSEAENLVEVDEFRLPVSEDEGVRGEVWRRRLRGEGNESEVEMPELNLGEEVPRVVDLNTSVEMVERVERGKKGKGGKGGKKASAAGGKEERRGSLAAVPSRRSARQAESTADEAEARSVDERQDEAEGEEEEEEDGESEDKESQASASTPAAARSTRSKGGAAAKSKPKRNRAKR